MCVHAGSYGSIYKQFIANDVQVLQRRLEICIDFGFPPSASAHTHDNRYQQNQCESR
ncbi:Unknown protein sequence [Pseudomonas syringae pv. maculicola]|nr:Unknown protein sequence [Pseudomonas syringae pv. maculicola]